MNNEQLEKVGLGKKVMFWEDIEIASHVAKKRNYNRQINLSKLKKDVKKVLKNQDLVLDDTKFAATPIMVHTHKSGEKCMPHMRISVYLPDTGSVLIDCDIDLWKSFPNVDV